jgi:hypothetical protein
MPEGELTKCPKCGRMVPTTKDCDCGYRFAWIKFCKANFDHALQQGWRVLRCPPTPVSPMGVSILVHPDKQCTNSACRFYPLKHRHFANDVQAVVIEDGPPGGSNRQ